VNANRRSGKINEPSQSLPMEYSRTQHGGFHYLLFTLALGAAIAAWANSDEEPLAWILLAMAGVFAITALMFVSLTVRDEGDYLAVRYGVLPILGTRIRYADILAVEPGRTTLFDGWGVHYVPFRGKTFNLWGFGCAKIELGKRTVRIGSDDVDSLVAFLRGRMAQAQAETSAEREQLKGNDA
jgi:hypothetical protein